MLDVFDIVVQSNELMHIVEIIAFISAEMLLTVWTFGDDVNNQVIGRPFVMFVRASDPNCQGSTVFIHQEMDFAA